jgi:hypothetical protein
MGFHTRVQKLYVREETGLWQLSNLPPAAENKKPSSSSSMDPQPAEQAGTG